MIEKWVLTLIVVVIFAAICWAADSWEYRKKMIEDVDIIAKLDDTWRTVGAIRTMLGGADAYYLALALSRMAATQAIEVMEKPLGIYKRAQDRKLREMTMVLYRRRVT